MAIFSFLRVVRSVYRLRKLVAVAVLLEFLLKRGMDLNNKRSSNPKKSKQDELKLMATGRIARAQSYLQNLKKQDTRR
jgi:hypothetical protein